jgi:predicted Zn-dependent protease
MREPNKGELLREKIASSIKNVWSGLVSVALMAFVILLWAANASTCVSRRETAQRSANNLKIVELDQQNGRHVKLQRVLSEVWFGATNAQEKPTLLIVNSSDINAASFGFGRFLVWDGVADLPDWIMRPIFAHEVAHDILKHSKKAQEVKDLTDFFGDLLSVFGRTDLDTENTLKRWVGYTALPKYSRTQEFEADTKAVEILNMLGDPNPSREMSEALRILIEKYGNTGGGFLDSHPATTERIQQLNGRANQQEIVRGHEK